ncbi:MAG TPA: SUMF1/EgtB/PvdO family nonheme iron enzyme [Polyangiaceae bacterium]|nr:SUMF1/EgtB/PvdO family nonheme iron enzyme [Polyangiaceae bacterium]
MFGWFLTLLAVVTVTAGSHAADRMRSRGGASGIVVGSEVADLQLLPRPPASNGDAALFGSFAKPGATLHALPSEDPCPPEMVEVEGDYCPYVEQKCLRWLDPETKLQCAEFDKTATSSRCSMKTQHKSFCIDRYEWPNKVGALPRYMASWYEAKQSCEATGKRLCSDTEWTLACEGEDRRPYPYGDGYARDQAACNIDKPYIWPRPERVYDPKTSSDELARLDQREASGARAACVSPYGVHDMVGNVDEWVLNVSQGGKPHLSGLKGGYWGPVRTRCRPMTTAHDETFRYYQIGFRCCGESQATDPGEAPMADNE